MSWPPMYIAPWAQAETSRDNRGEGDRWVNVASGQVRGGRHQEGNRQTVGKRYREESPTIKAATGHIARYHHRSRAYEDEEEHRNHLRCRGAPLQVCTTASHGSLLRAFFVRWVHFPRRAPPSIGVRSQPLHGGVSRSCHTLVPHIRLPNDTRTSVISTTPS